LQLGYESLRSSDYRDAEEEDITGDIRKYMKYLTDEAPTERWMARYSVYNEDPVDDGRCVLTGEIKKGKRRLLIDVRVVCKRRTPVQSYVIEAKRLYRSDSVAQYCGEDGLGAFLAGEYAAADDRAGMVAYVQRDTVAVWTKKLEKKTKWGRVVLRRGPPDCFMSEHKRHDGRAIRLFHVMFDFVK
jgi:hypothetical protein